MRVAIYARFSSEKQNERSADDQIRACRDRAEREGWRVVETFDDRAISGASIDRPGLNQLIRDAGAGAFDIVLAESLDRVYRDQEHIARFFKAMSFWNIKFITLSEGHINELHIGLKGTMSALFLKDLADKTRRGMGARVDQGRVAGGLCYGYDAALGDGESGRIINEAEATIVREIFTSFAHGISPRAIAVDLNRRGVPSPRGKHGNRSSWQPSTIYGNNERGTGILNNELYAGRLIWNRLRYVKNPATGKRESRLNDPGDHKIAELPDLRIVDQALWDQVKARQRRINKPRIKTANVEAFPFWDRRRPRHLLSGLVRCGCCGASYTAYGQTSLKCAGAQDRGTCDNHATIRRQALEAAVLEGLRDQLVTAAALEQFTRDYTTEMTRLQKERRAGAAQRHVERQKIITEMENIIAMIKKGIASTVLATELEGLERRKSELDELIGQENTENAVVTLHPNLAEAFRRKIENLHALLANEATKASAMDAIRHLIEAVVLTPRGEELVVELRGQLAAILQLCAGGWPQSKEPDIAAGLDIDQVKLVAGARFELTTFRL